MDFVAINCNGYNPTRRRRPTPGAFVITLSQEPGPESGRIGNIAQSIRMRHTVAQRDHPLRDHG